MKAIIYKNGKKITVTTSPDLRSGVLVDVDGNIIKTFAEYLAYIKNYLDIFYSHGVKSFVFAFTTGGKTNGVTHYVRATRTQILNNPTYFYSWNTDGEFLALTFRVDKKAAQWLLANCVEISRQEYETLKAIETELNNGYKAEMLLYGRAQTKKTFSDGKSLNQNGKKENTQLKSSIYNSSGSRSKACNIWSAKYSK